MRSRLYITAVNRHLAPARLRMSSIEAPHEIETVELAGPGPGEVVVRIAGSGLCHTDILPRTPAFPGQVPVIAGHKARVWWRRWVAG
jgi:aryl-alcohol dehydrogenase